MAVLTVQKPTADAPLAVVYGAASSTGDAYVNTGRERLRVRNNAIPTAQLAAPAGPPTLGATTPAATVATPTNPIANPVSAPGLSTAGTGGFIAAGTYTVGITWTRYLGDVRGETLLSPTATITTSGTTSTITVNPGAFPSGGYGFNIYIAAVGTTTPLYRQNSGDVTSGTYTQTAAIATTGPQPPTANNTGAPNCAITTSNGTWPMGSFTIGYTWTTANGETQISPTIVETTADFTSYVMVTVPAFPSGATGWNLYVSAVGTTTPLYKQNTTPLTGTSESLFTGPVSGTSTPPASNTTGYTNLPAGTYTVAYAWGTQLGNPAAAPALSTATTGGNLPAGTYTCGYTWTTAYGETILSPTAAIVIPAGTATNTIVASVPPPPIGVTGWNLYIAAVGTTTPLYRQTATPVNAATSYTQTAAITTATANPPGADSAEIGETPLGPTANITITAGQQINLTAIASLPAGAAYAAVYLSQAAGSSTLLRSGQATTTTYNVNALPTGAAPAQLVLTVTLVAQKKCNQGFLHNGGGSVVAGGEETWGASDPYRFDVGNQLDITYSTAGSVQVAVVG